MATTIEFKGNSAYINIGNSDISGNYAKSPNGQFFMICDTLYTQSGNSCEYAIVFTKHDIIYKKPIPNDCASLAFYVFDDSSSLVLTDENDILRYDLSGKQTKKATDIDPEKYDLIGNVFYVIGNNDDGNTALFCYDLQNGKSSRAVVPDIEYNDGSKEDQISCDVEYLLIDDRFVFLYENNTDAVAFDLKCQPTQFYPSDIETIKQIRIQKAIEMESEKKRREQERMAYLQQKQEATIAAQDQLKKRRILIGIIVAVFVIMFFVVLLQK